jgi:hypothetical protein
LIDEALNDVATCARVLATVVLDGAPALMHVESGNSPRALGPARGDQPFIA